MTTINSSSLFHFTDEVKWLKEIITKGIRFSYSYEKDFNQGAGVAIPMACFCDIPLQRTVKHRKRYGNYMIGLDKEMLIHYYSSIINPVIYTHSENLISAASSLSDMRNNYFESQVSEIINISKELSASFLGESYEEIISNPRELVKKSPELNKLMNWRFELNFMQGLCKPYEGTDKKGDKVVFYDEREWRAFWCDGADKATNWEYYSTFEDFEIDKTQLNENISNSENGYITLFNANMQEAITHIIVSKETDIPEIIDHILQSKSIFGENNISYVDRLMLISRVTSFERIENDY